MDQKVDKQKVSCWCEAWFCRDKDKFSCCLQVQLEVSLASMKIWGLWFTFTIELLTQYFMLTSYYYKLHIHDIDLENLFVK